MKITEDTIEERPDIFSILTDLQQRYRNVFVFQAEEAVFIYRALGRKEYKNILQDNRFNDFEKEELICSTCLLYPDPETIDWDDMDAGIPTELMKHIREHSYLDSIASRKNLLDFYRSEMYDLDNQITCIINEAFPNLDIEEIEDWDIEKTMKYLTRAEWKLTNFHGLQFKEPEGEFYGEQEEMQKAITEEIQPDNEPSSAPKKTIRGGDRSDKLTPDKIRAKTSNKNVGREGTMSLEELRQKFPDVDWGSQDLGLQGEKGLVQDTVDDLAPALRPGW